MQLPNLNYRTQSATIEDIHFWQRSIRFSGSFFFFKHFSCNFWFYLNLPYPHLSQQQHYNISQSFQLTLVWECPLAHLIHIFLLASLGTIEQVTILTVIYAFSSLSLSLSSRLRLNWTEHQPGTVHTHTITDYYCNYYYHYYYDHYSLV